MMGDRPHQNGFTLIEVAIVLLIVGLLTRSLIGPIASTLERQRYLEAESKLHLIKESLLAHVVATGALPCPVASMIGSDARQVIDTNRVCDIGQGGLPTSSLGIAGATNENGALLDPWSRPYLYAVSLANHSTEGDESLPDWTTAGEASYVGIPNLSSNLTLCSQAGVARCPMSQIRANDLAFVVLTQGYQTAESPLELENVDNDETFVVAEHSLLEADAYDDQIIWSSAQEVMYWMLRAAWLP